MTTSRRPGGHPDGRLGPHGGVDVVLEHHRQPQRLLEGEGHRHLHQRQVGRGDDHSPLGVDGAGAGQTERLGLEALERRERVPADWLPARQGRRPGPRCRSTRQAWERAPSRHGRPDPPPPWCPPHRRPGPRSSRPLPFPRRTPGLSKRLLDVTDQTDVVVPELISVLNALPMIAAPTVEILRRATLDRSQDDPRAAPFCAPRPRNVRAAASPDPCPALPPPPSVRPPTRPLR